MHVAVVYETHVEQQVQHMVTAQYALADDATRLVPFPVRIYMLAETLRGPEPNIAGSAIKRSLVPLKQVKRQINPMSIEKMYTQSFPVFNKTTTYLTNLKGAWRRCRSWGY